MAHIDIQSLSFKYRGNESYALRNINLEINRGDFIVICGESGCGKSTLLKLLKRQIAPKGDLSGAIFYNGADLYALDERASVSSIGFVAQNPENQIVTDKVWHELAFGLESLGEGSGAIRRKVAEVSAYFGITEWYDKRTDELSGGQKQLLNLASVMVMNPETLILDEPTGQLDPVAASGFISTLKKLNNELGITVILAEHRLEEVFPIADKVVVMDKAEVFLFDEPRKIGELLSTYGEEHKMRAGLPSAMRIYKELEGKGDCPLTVKEGRDYLKRRFENECKALPVSEPVIEKKECAIKITEAFFRYERHLPDVVKGLCLEAYNNEFLCVLGANGAGKTTLLSIMCGVQSVYRGSVKIFGKNIKDYGWVGLYRNNVALLPQNPLLMFVKGMLRDDLEEVTSLIKLCKEESERRITRVCKDLGLEGVLHRHPYDLSGGEQQKAALAKLLLLEPRLILLDEPTKGVDAYSKRTLAETLARLKKEGKTIVMVTHDVEFAAEYADRCAMFFDGKIVSVETPETFFSENNFYTTSASRMSRGLFKDTVTVGQVVRLCKMNKEKA